MNKHITKIIKFIKDPLLLGYWESKSDYYLSRRKKDNQLSVHISGHNKRRVSSYYGDSHMLIEDMYLGIMPFMHSRGERDKYPSKIEPSTTNLEHMISGGLSNKGYRTFMGDAITDFVRTASHVLFQDGVAFYEIIPTNKEDGSLESFQIELLQPFYIYRFFNNYYQFIDWREAKETHTRVRLIKIPKERILKISIPKKITNRRTLKSILERMYKLSREIIPDFQMKAMSEDTDIGFDSNEYINSKYIEIATLTRMLGWNQRQLSTNHTTEYYSIVRFLRTKKAQALVREEVMRKLNEALNGSVLNLGVSVSIENLFTVKDVETLEENLKRGDIEFMSIFNATNI